MSGHTDKQQRTSVCVRLINQWQYRRMATYKQALPVGRIRRLRRRPAKMFEHCLMALRLSGLRGHDLQVSRHPAQ
ncbi:TPA: hypothetical protein U2L47_002416 [Citrobacter koseri]|uniref:hypothetical protein n=1 Tax=Citrobacter koseri TaxID=545 RepID=UPI000FD8A292|nr:hypothetical protein [Citrobacter koseri]EKX8768037.1 hypothetical protein [Citrobacter koseri]MBJ8806712.1 hypothetical protein [Citrobacter koseri]HEM7962268.1 hypothetical protein [Citrobacter koseri]